MESYRVSGIPSSGPQRGYAQPSRPSKPQSNGAGTYGLSIRVQGIDGHPFVVLNNQDGGPHTYMDPRGNGYIDTEDSFINSYDEYDFRRGKEAESNSPFVEYRTQKMLHYTGPQNGVTESQGKKPSSLLNFQKHPEILQPYDPETNSLNLEGFNSLPSRPDTGSQPQSWSPRSAASHRRASSLDRKKDATPLENRQPTSQSVNEAGFPKLKPQLTQPQSRPQSQLSQPQIKAPLTTLNPAHPKLTSKTPHQPVPPAQPQPSTVSSPRSSATSSLERTPREPDVLPLRRTDSSEPILQPSSRSRHSSSSSTSKTPMDEQMEALYADTINRHENRRYIPFMPGSGRDIDTDSIPGVDELIEKFDGKDGTQRRGRAGRRNRINPEDRKRSRSVDSALGLQNSSSYTELHQGTSKEHVLLPSQLRMQKSAGSQDSWLLDHVDSRSHATSAPGSPQNTISKGVGSIQGYKNPQTQSSSLSFKIKASEESEKVLTSSLSSSLSRPSSLANKKPGTDMDVQVKCQTIITASYICLF